MEEIKILYEDEKIRTEQILSHGYASPPRFWYDQEEDEYASVVRGEAVLNVEGKEIRLTAGETAVLPAHTRHHVESTSEDCEWFCVFLKKPE